MEHLGFEIATHLVTFGVGLVGGAVIVKAGLFKKMTTTVSNKANS